MADYSASGGEGASGPEPAPRPDAAVKPRWARDAQVRTLCEIEAHQQATEVSERQAAAAAGVARSTLRHWRQRQSDCDLAPEVVAFFESPVGLEWLHRLVVAAHLVITLLGCGGVRLVCRFLELTGLSAVVASSYGAQQPIAMALEAAVVAFGEAERTRLGAAMPSRTINLCEDETFHPEVCLVGIEPVSNFIVLERYAHGRTAADWTAALQAALAGLPVTVNQVASDEAKGLCHHVTHALGAHHAPDLFHVQHEISRATAAVLCAQGRHAEQALVQAQQALAEQQAAQMAYAQGPRPPGRPPAFARRIDQAQGALAGAQLRLEQVQALQAEAQAVRQELSAAYHPYDLATGQVQTPDQVAGRLARCWQRLQTLAEVAALPERCHQRLRKAQRVGQVLVATVSFYFATVTAKVEALGLPPALEAVLYKQLIPALYLDRVADRGTDRDQRVALRQRVAALLAPLRASDGPLTGLPADEHRVLEQVATDCAQLFQRSSSCVEGRNGQLALHQHSRHRLSERKLAALTTVHNYLLQRSDGTTAAERFFGQQPANLFEAVLPQVQLPGRPARKRPPPKKPPYLLPVAA